MIAYELQPKPDFDSITQVSRQTSHLGLSDVRVRVRAVALNYRDLGIARGALRRTLPPVIVASDGAGEVVAVGSAVTRFKGGERVAANFFPTWIDGGFLPEHHTRALGGTIDGMLAQEVVLDEQALVVVPPHLSFEEAATLPCAGVTAYHALFELAPVGPGQIVLVQGTGGVSIFALQLAKAAGARVIVTSQHEAKRERALSLGADHVIDYKANPEWGEAVLAWTDGRGVDVVVEVGGSGTFNQSTTAARYGGTVSLIGTLTGISGEINTYRIFQKALRIRGVYVGSRRMFESLNAAISATKMRPVVDRVFALSETKLAYEHQASGTHFGKVVIRVD